MINNINRLTFICSPGIGILDNWIPVIHQLKQLKPQLIFTIVIPKAGTVELIDCDSELVKIASNIFDEILFKTWAGTWVSVNNFNVAIKINSTSGIHGQLNRLLQLKYQFTFPPIVDTSLSAVAVFIEKNIYGLKIIDLNRALKTTKAVLYDLYEDKKEYMQEIISSVNGAPLFSMHHGIYIRLELMKTKMEYVRKNKLIAFLFSAMETKLYQHGYSLNENNLCVTGVPRHDPCWVQFIKNKSEIDSNIPWVNYVFLISRSSSSSFPPDRKKEVLLDVKKLIVDKLNMKLVIKLHPKERHYGLYEEVFKDENYGKNWIYSNLHPFVISDKALFAICSFSGVCVDMVAMGVPVIEYINLVGLKNFDNKESLRDENDFPVFSYRYLNLVKAANDFVGLEQNVMSILNNRKEVMHQLKKRHEEVFGVEKPSLQKVVDRILYEIN